MISNIYVFIKVSGGQALLNSKEKVEMPEFGPRSFKSKPRM